LIAKKQKTKILTGHGTLGVSNLNSESECITLTYTTFNIKSAKDVAALEEEFTNLVDDEMTFDLLITDHGTTEQAVKLKTKVKTCESEARGREIKETFDTFIKKKGGQTTLDEPGDGE